MTKKIVQWLLPVVVLCGVLGMSYEAKADGPQTWNLDFTSIDRVHYSAGADGLFQIFGTAYGRSYLVEGTLGGAPAYIRVLKHCLDLAEHLNGGMLRMQVNGSISSTSMLHASVQYCTLYK